MPGDPKIIGSLAWMNWRANPVYDVAQQQSNVLITNEAASKILIADDGKTVLVADYVKRLVRWI